MKAVRLRQANWLADWIAGDAGDIRILTEQQAYEAVILHKIATYAPEYDPAQVSPPVEFTPPVQQPEVTEFPGTVVDQDALEAGYPVDIDPEPGYPADIDPEPGERAELKMPWVTHSKAEWINWAVHHGANPALVAAMTKAEIMSRYGERL